MPTHVNQFATGAVFPKGPYRGQSSEAYDCTVAVGMMALDDFTGGRIRPSATEFRSRQDDNDKSGIGLDDVAKVWRSYGLTFSHSSRSWSAVMARLRAGSPVALQGWSGALGPYKVGRAVPHAIYATMATASGLTIHDPLRRGPTVIPESYVRRFYLTGLALAGWGVGASAASSAGPTATLAAATTHSTLAAFLGIPPATRVTADHVRTAADRIATATGMWNRAYPAVLAELTGYLNGHPGITAGDFPIVTTSSGAPPGLDPLAGFDPLGGIGDAIGEGVFVLVVGGTIAALFLLGAWRLTK